jgi:hypothetical protein
MLRRTYTACKHLVFLTLNMTVRTLKTGFKWLRINKLQIFYGIVRVLLLPIFPLKFWWGYRDAHVHEITGINTQVKFCGMFFCYWFKVFRGGWMFTVVFCEHRPTATCCLRVIELNTLCGVMLEQSSTNTVKVKLSLLWKLKPKIENRGGNALRSLRLELAFNDIPAAAKWPYTRHKDIVGNGERYASTDSYRRY